MLLENSRAEAIRTPEWMYAEHRTRDGVERELYDMRADSHQLRSLHRDAEYATVREQLAARLAGLRDCQGEDCRG